MFDMTIAPRTALVIRPSGSGKWQYRGRIAEYRVWTCKDGRRVWRFYRTVQDSVPAGNIKGGICRCVTSPHNTLYRP